ncbi:HET-like protein [Alternaria alternata]|nr:HET-like protein [Alternaria alternata]
MRLLQIEQVDEDRVRLLVNPFSDSAFAPRYATLSHCWGRDPFFMLTNQTKNRLTSGILTSILSQTFQDAIAVAKSLEIQYIWIDSLCIIQDSKQDWEEQAPLMDEVYSRALLCIAATASAKSSSGCFRTREASSRVTCEVKTSWDDRPNGVYQIYNERVWPNTFEDQPLISRAWVVQELLLPPRILYFNSNQIFWQCYDKHACEELPTHINVEWMVWQQENDFKFSTYDHHHRSLTGDRASPIIRKNEFMHNWHIILMRYTKCRLTFLKDKLVAISGIAKLFREPLSDTYCAGLWIRRMPTELLWTRGIWDLPKPALPKAKLDSYQAPSWSWASMDGPVTPDYLYDQDQDSVVILVEIKSCHATTKTGDAFSEVLNGIIRLSGFLSRMQLRPVPDSETVTHWSAFTNGVWLDHADRSGQPCVVLDHKPLDPQEMFCLPILLQRDFFGWRLKCLILVAIEGKKDTFERLGRVNIPIKELLAGYRGSELGGEDSFSEFENVDRHVEVQSRDSAWHHFILSWSKHVVNPRKPDDSLEFETIAVQGAVEISIE